MKCLKCGSTSMKKTVGDHLYRESGMDHVILRNVNKFDCQSCHHQMVPIERVGQLHRLLAEIIANKPARLVPSEVRFLRDHLEISNKEFAALMGVSESQSSRWTHTESMGAPAEHFLRMLATLGPLVLAAGATTVKTLPAEPIVRTLNHLPLARDVPAKGDRLIARRTSSEWKSESQPSAN